MADTVLTLYQLTASGPMRHWESGHRFYSKKVFLTREAAEKHKDEFIRSCTTAKNDLDMFILERVDSVEIMEVELVLDEAQAQPSLLEAVR